MIDFITSFLTNIISLFVVFFFFLGHLMLRELGGGHMNFVVMFVLFFFFLFQNYPERSIYKVLTLMLRRGELQHRLQRKMLYRMK